MVMIEGTLLGFKQERREYTDGDGARQSFDSRTLHVLSGLEVHVLELARGFEMGSIPKEGTHVLIEVSARAKNSRIYWNAVQFLEGSAAAA